MLALRIFLAEERTYPSPDDSSLDHGDRLCIVPDSGSGTSVCWGSERLPETDRRIPDAVPGALAVNRLVSTTGARSSRLDFGTETA